MSYFFLGILLLLFVVTIAYLFTNAKPAAVARFVRTSGVVILLLLVAYLTLTGRLFALFGLLPLVAPAISKLRAYFLRQKFERQAASGNKSHLESQYLKMTLDHQTGEIEGVVLQGNFKQKSLESLTYEDLIALFTEIKDDPKSVQMLENYMNLRFGQDWSHETKQTKSTNSKMSVDQAYEVLGLEKGASKAEIKKKYHALMQALHPDQGGSNFLASQINEAYEILKK